MVEWKHMWEVTTWDKKFTGVDKSMQPDIKKYHYYLGSPVKPCVYPKIIDSL